MKVGDLVWISQQFGCYSPPRYHDRGIGVVLKVTKSKPVSFQGMGEVNLGDDVTVLLEGGAVEVFNEESVRSV